MFHYPSTSSRKTNRPKYTAITVCSSTLITNAYFKSWIFSKTDCPHTQIPPWETDSHTVDSRWAKKFPTVFMKPVYVRYTQQSLLDAIQMQTNPVHNLSYYFKLYFNIILPEYTLFTDILKDSENFCDNTHIQFHSSGLIYFGRKNISHLKLQTISIIVRVRIFYFIERHVLGYMVINMVQWIYRRMKMTYVNPPYVSLSYTERWPHICCMRNISFCIVTKRTRSLRQIIFMAKVTCFPRYSNIIKYENEEDRFKKLFSQHKYTCISTNNVICCVNRICVLKD